MNSYKALCLVLFAVDYPIIVIITSGQLCYLLTQNSEFHIAVAFFSGRKRRTADITNIKTSMTSNTEDMLSNTGL